MPERSVGNLELETLRHIAEHAPASVGEVASAFGEPRGLARTTILTVMERLRRKGFLSRTRTGGVYRYTPQVEHGVVLKQLVQRFVATTLAGSVSPFVAYLADSADLSDSEIAELRRLVASLEAEDRRGPQ